MRIPLYFGLTLLSLGHAFIVGLDNYCMSCNDSDPQHPCTKHGYSACKTKDGTPYCLNIVKNDGFATKVIKRCGSRTECHSKWWHQTKIDNSCTSSAISSNTLPPGKTCVFCCAGLYCNANNYPHHLLSFPDPAGTPSATSSHLHTTHSVHTRYSQYVTRYPYTSTAATAHHHNTPYPHASICMNCQDDPSRGIKCNVGKDHSPCRGFCMTSYSSNGTSYRIDKRCASRDECYRLWWQDTSIRPACFRNDLLTSPSTNPHPCHYCCRADGSHPFCNDEENRVIPAQLLLFSAGTSTTTPATTVTTLTSTSTTTTSTSTSTTTISTTTTTTTPQPMKLCQVCADSGSRKCTPTDVLPCRDRDMFCMNTLEVQPSGKRILTKTCATDTECYTDWWQQTRPQGVCIGNLSNIPNTKHGLLCKWCCNNTSPDQPCNRDVRPTRLLKYDTSTTVTTTTATSTTTTTTTSTTTTATPTSSTTATTSTTNAKTTSKSKGITCWDCSNGCPFIQTPMTCPSGYCLTTISDDSTFTRTIRKTCVDRDTCHSKWWLQTSDKSLCVSMMNLNRNVPTGVNIECNYCCVTDNCNKGGYPLKGTLYDGNGKKG